MRKVLAFLLVLAAAIIVLLVVRTYVATVYLVPGTAFEPLFQRGERVIVLRLSRYEALRGDVVVWRSDVAEHMGRIDGMPGDTLAIGDALYIIPADSVCAKCGCTHCHQYIVDTDSTLTLIRQTDIVGKVRRLLPPRK